MSRRILCCVNVYKPPSVANKQTQMLKPPALLKNFRPFSMTVGFRNTKTMTVSRLSNTQPSYMRSTNTKRATNDAPSSLKPSKPTREELSPLITSTPTLAENMPPTPKVEKDVNSKKILARLFAYGLNLTIFTVLFAVAAQYAAHREDEHYALKCFGPTSPLVEEVLDSIRAGNDSGNPNGFIPCVPTRGDMYNLLFEMNGHVNMQFLIHAYRLDSNSEYYSNSILGKYKANRISVRMELMNQYMNLVLGAALKLGYLTAQDSEHFAKTGYWSLPCIYHIPKGPAPTILDKNWYKLWKV